MGIPASGKQFLAIFLFHIYVSTNIGTTATAAPPFNKPAKIQIPKKEIQRSLLLILMKNTQKTILCKSEIKSNSWCKSQI